MFRERQYQFQSIGQNIWSSAQSTRENDQKGRAFYEFPDTIKKHFDYGGEILLGHLRYGTSGEYGSNTCHPYFRKSNWPSKNLMIAGNFNLTNVEELNQKIGGAGTASSI